MKEQLKKYKDIIMNLEFKNIDLERPKQKVFVRGNVRLNMGLYRTKRETDKYIKDSLKVKLP